MTTPTKSRRRFAPDPRLLVGLALVVASVVGVVALVLALDDTIEVYSARDVLTPGERVRPGDLEVSVVRLDAASPRYLAPGGVPEEGVVVTRTIGAGELVPVAAVADEELAGFTSVVISVGGSVPARVEAGALVDVWAASEDETGRFAEPEVLVERATVVGLTEDGSIVMPGDVSAVEVLVPRSRVPRVLAALANEDALSIVPSPVG